MRLTLQTMRSRSAVASLLLASTDTHAHLVADALVRAHPELERIGPEAASKGHGWVIFITDADQVDLDGAPAADIAKHAALKPDEPWVELLPMKRLLAMFGDEDGGGTYDDTVKRLGKASHVPLAPGYIWVVVAIGGTVVAFHVKPIDARIPQGAPR